MWLVPFIVHAIVVNCFGLLDRLGQMPLIVIILFPTFPLRCLLLVPCFPSLLSPDPLILKVWARWSTTLCTTSPLMPASRGRRRAQLRRCGVFSYFCIHVMHVQFRSSAWIFIIHFVAALARKGCGHGQERNAQSDLQADAVSRGKHTHTRTRTRTSTHTRTLTCAHTQTHMHTHSHTRICAFLHVQSRIKPRNPPWYFQCVRACFML